MPKNLEPSEFKVYYAFKELKQLAVRLSKMNAVEVGQFINKSKTWLDAEQQKDPASASIMFLLLQGVHAKLTEAIQEVQDAQRPS